MFTTEDTLFIPGKAQVLWKSRAPSVALIGCGPLLYNALLAAKELEKEKIGVVVLNCHTIKPLDDEAVVKAVKECGAVVTIEEHQVAGGLGGAVAELLARRSPMPQEFIGMQDTFGESGSPTELIEKYGMGVKSIMLAAKKVIKRKK